MTTPKGVAVSSQCWVNLNPSLDERPGRARLVVGGLSDGRVFVAEDGYMLSGAGGVYAPATVHIAGHVIPTWIVPGQSATEHVEGLILWLIASAGDVLEEIMEAA